VENIGPKPDHADAEVYPGVDNWLIGRVHSDPLVSINVCKMTPKQHGRQGTNAGIPESHQDPGVSIEY
jgi:hypothetical protein